MSSKIVKLLPLFLSALCCSGVVESRSLSGLSVMPTRLILSDRNRSSAVMLRNTSDSEINYRIQFVDMGLSADHSLVEMNEKDQPVGFKSLSPFARFSPRQVSLKPGESQTIRVLIKRAEGIMDAEYRSHLEIRVLPSVSSFDLLEQIDPNVVRPGMVARIGVTLPVVWRKGDLAGSAAISKAVFSRRADGEIGDLTLKVRRTGSRSVFGDITVSAVLDDGEVKNIATLNDYGIYQPYEFDDIVLSVENITFSEFEKIKNLNIKFTNDESTVGLPVVFDENVDWVVEDLPIAK